MALWRNIKCHHNIFRINFFIREAGKLGLSHLVFPSDSAGVSENSLGIEIEKQGGWWIYLLTCTGVPFSVF